MSGEESRKHAALVTDNCSVTHLCVPSDPARPVFPPATPREICERGFHQFQHARDVRPPCGTNAF